MQLIIWILISSLLFRGDITYWKHFLAYNFGAYIGSLEKFKDFNKMHKYTEVVQSKEKKTEEYKEE